MSLEATTDTVTLELINGTLRAAREEMEALIDRTAMSPFIREKKDFFTAFLNRDGKLVVSTSLTLSGNLVEGVFAHYPSQTMADGDLYIYNDAYGTGGGVSHLPTWSSWRRSSTTANSSPSRRPGDISGTSAAWCRAASAPRRPAPFRRAS